EEKITLFKASAKVSALSCVTAENLHLGARILTSFPFKGIAQALTLKQSFFIS
ncbi:hypothetical protein K504DRAFT_394410, partial [Pleomassaria siparia CBS 279.74]